jgi:hypothetical protein
MTPRFAFSKSSVFNGYRMASLALPNIECLQLSIKISGANDVLAHLPLSIVHFAHVVALPTLANGVRTAEAAARRSSACGQTVENVS